ncbi:MAG: hypothetical protein IIZ20_11645 [Butyrivibrio sp.]|nr:hypothetical protein [Butyrivibrio sp.]
MDREAYREKLKMTKQKSARLLRPDFAAEYFGVERKTIMKIAIKCGARIEMGKSLVWIDTERVEEYLLSKRNEPQIEGRPKR